MAFGMHVFGFSVCLLSVTGFLRKIYPRALAYQYPAAAESIQAEKAYDLNGPIKEYYEKLLKTKGQIDLNITHVRILPIEEGDIECTLPNGRAARFLQTQKIIGEKTIVLTKESQLNIFEKKYRWAPSVIWSTIASVYIFITFLLQRLRIAFGLVNNESLPESLEEAMIGGIVITTHLSYGNIKEMYNTKLEYQRHMQLAANKKPQAVHEDTEIQHHSIKRKKIA